MKASRQLERPLDRETETESEMRVRAPGSLHSRTWMPGHTTGSTCSTWWKRNPRLYPCSVRRRKTSGPALQPEREHRPTAAASKITWDAAGCISYHSRRRCCASRDPCTLLGSNKKGLFARLSAVDEKSSQALAISHASIRALRPAEKHVIRLHCTEEKRKVMETHR